MRPIIFIRGIYINRARLEHSVLQARPRLRSQKISLFTSFPFNSHVNTAKFLGIKNYHINTQEPGISFGEYRVLHSIQRGLLSFGKLITHTKECLISQDKLSSPLLSQTLWDPVNRLSLIPPFLSTITSLPSKSSKDLLLARNKFYQSAYEFISFYYYADKIKGFF